MKKQIIFGIMMVLLIQMVSAEIVVNKYTNEFKLSSTQISGKACSCSDFTFPFTVDNVGDEEGVFHISVEGPEFFQKTEDSFYLEAGEATTSSVIAQIPCGWTGTADYSVIVDSTYGREKAIDRTLEVVQCQNIMIQPPADQIVKPGEVGVFSFTVENTAPFADTYRINVEDFEGNVELSETEFELPKDGEKEIFAYVRFPDWKWGDFSIPLTVTTVNNGLSKDVNLNLRVLKAYEYSLKAEGAVKACSDLVQDVPVTITNNAEVENTYDLSLKGPGYAELSAQEVTLEPNASLTFTVKMSPKAAADDELVVKAVSQKGGIERQTSIDVTVEDCYGLSLTAPAEVVMVCGEEDIDVNVRNLGTKKAKLALSMNAPDWAAMEANAATLETAENKNIGVHLAPPCADGTYELDFEARNRDEPSFTDKASTTVKVYTPESAYEVELRQRNFDVEYGQDEVHVIVDNVGIRDGTYNVMLDSEFLTLGTEQISIEAGGSETIVLHVGNTSGLEYGEYLHGLSFGLAGYNITYTADIGTNLKGPGFFQRIGIWFMNTFVHSQWYNKLGWCGWSGILLLLAIIALITTEAMIRQDKIKTKRFRKDQSVHFRLVQGAFAVLAVLALIFFFANFSTNKAELYEAPVEGELVHNVYEGETYAIDLADYFSDPDDDNLVYTYESETVSVDIDGSEATLVGEGEVVFTATDEAGAVEQSPAMTVNVVDRKEDLNWVDYWLANCTAVNVLLIALLFIVLLVLSEEVAPRGREYYFGERK